jgi:hypothetical protein
MQMPKIKIVIAPQDLIDNGSLISDELANPFPPSRFFQDKKVEWKSLDAEKTQIIFQINNFLNHPNAMVAPNDELPFWIFDTEKYDFDHLKELELKYTINGSPIYILLNLVADRNYWESKELTYESLNFREGDGNQIVWEHLTNYLSEDMANLETGLFFFRRIDNFVVDGDVLLSSYSEGAINVTINQGTPKEDEGLASDENHTAEDLSDDEEAPGKPEATSIRSTPTEEPHPPSKVKIQPIKANTTTSKQTVLPRRSPTKIKPNRKPAKAFLDAALAKGYQVTTKISEEVNPSKGQRLIERAKLQAGNSATKEVKAETKTQQLQKTFKAKRKIKSIEALQSFNRVASLVLTEPYLYKDTPEEVQAELTRIQDRLKSKVLPCFYSTLEMAACGKNHLQPYGNINNIVTNAISSETTNIATEMIILGSAGLVGMLLAPIVLPAAIAAALTATAVTGLVATEIVITGGIAAWSMNNADKNVRRNLKRVEYGIEALAEHVEKLVYTEEQIAASSGLLISNQTSNAKTIAEMQQRKLTAEKVQAVALGKTGEAGPTINGAINMLTGKYFASLPAFKHLEDIVYEMGASSALNLILKPENIERTKNDYEHPLNLYASEIIGLEAQEYLAFLLRFPALRWQGSAWPDTDDATNIFSFGKSQVDLIKPEHIKNHTYNTGTYDFLTQETLFNMQCNQIVKDESSDSLYRKRVEGEAESKPLGTRIYTEFFDPQKLEQHQNKKIEFLIQLRDALTKEVLIANVEEFYDDEEYRKYVETFDGNSIFKIMDTSAYPDIDLPDNYASFKNVKKLDPDFYYFKPTVKELKSRDSKVLKRLIRNSSQFKEDIRTKVVSNIPLELGGFSDGFRSTGVIHASSGSSAIPVGEQRVTFADMPLSADGAGDEKALKDFLETASLQEIPLTPAKFKNPTEFENYIASKKKKITAVAKDLKSLNSFMGQKNYKKTYSTKEVEELLKTAPKGSPAQKISSALGLGDSINYNSEETLQKLALDSYELEELDAGMMKAFPTFKFYIVEEDAFYSDKLIAYDDFYSYASVVSFNVNNSRELPAATAQIQLQNVSGVLDGSKKDVLRDIDVDSRRIKSDADDEIQRSIESIVLRPGINAQLRAGYTGSSNELEILISGRITEISYSGDGMMINITVQSYGVELDQKIEKNLARNNKDNQFYSTHQLLGGLMLSPQLKHFGRIKTGRIFQDKEATSASLDTRSPSSKAAFSFYYTNTFMKTLGDWSWQIGSAILLAPILKHFGGPLLRKFAITRTPISYVGRLGATGWSKTANLAASATTRIGKAAAAPIKVMSVTKDLVQRITGRAAIFFRPPLAPSWKLERMVANQILQKIKNKTITAVGDLSLMEQHYLVTLNTNLTSARHTVGLTTFGEIITKHLTSAGKVADFPIAAETILLARAIQVEGAVVSLTNYSAGAYGIASAANSARVSGLLASSYTPGLASFIKQTAGSYFRSNLQTGVAVTGAVVSLGMIGFYADSIYNAAKLAKYTWDQGVKGLFDGEEDDTLRILLSPQDDNLFLPSSESYLRGGKITTNFFGELELVGLNVGRFASGVLGLTSVGATNLVQELFGVNLDETQLQKRFQEFKELFDTRLNIDNSENVYVLKNQTIFEVFHEMSLRHPGFVYGARPYGDSMEYRMFFGLPSQRYWAEDISLVDAVRINRILKEHLKSPQNLLSTNTCKSLYAKEYRNLTPHLEEAAIQTFITEKALKEYLEKTKKRFRPFRKLHLVSSDRNIVANNIAVTGHDVINTVSVNYKLTYKDGSQLVSSTAEGSTFAINLSSNTGIPENLKKPKTVNSNNIIGPSAAYRYGIGELLYGGRSMYSGSVLTLGNPKVNPWDVLIINDEVNRMYGPVEVKAVNHMFSHETGFLTDIEVNALVTYGEDTLTYPMMCSSILAQAKEKIYYDYASRVAFDRDVAKSTEFYKNLIEEIIDRTFEDTDASESFKKGLKTELASRLKTELDLAEKQGRPFFLRDVLANDIRIPEDLKRQARRLSGTALVGGGLIFGAEQATNRIFNYSTGLKALRPPVGVGFGVFLATAAGLTIFNDAVFDNIESSLNSGRLGKNLFRPVLMSKISNQSLIEVYPLVKDGKPLLAGGFEGVPASQSYQNILGNIYSDISDGMKGFLKFQQEIEKEGAGAVYTFDKDFIVRKESTASKLGKSLGTAISYVPGDLI